MNTNLWRHRSGSRMARTKPNAQSTP